MITNKDVYNCISEGVSRACMSAYNKIRKGWGDLPNIMKMPLHPEDYFAINRAISESIAESVLVFSEECQIEKTAANDAGYEKHCKKEMIYRIAAQLYEQNLFQTEEINAFTNLSRPWRQYRMTIPVFDWRKNDK